MKQADGVLLHAFEQVRSLVVRLSWELEYAAGAVVPGVSAALKARTSATIAALNELEQAARLATGHEKDRLRGLVPVVGETHYPSFRRGLDEIEQRRALKRTVSTEPGADTLDPNVSNAEFARMLNLADADPVAWLHGQPIVYIAPLVVNEGAPVSSSYLIARADGFRWIYKPAANDLPLLRSVVLDGDYARRETDAFIVSDECGFDLVKRTSIWTEGPAGEGSVQEWEPATRRVASITAYSLLGQQRVAVLDYVIGNLDRHVFNHRGRPVDPLLDPGVFEEPALDPSALDPLAYDNSLAFPAGRPQRAMVSDFVIQHLGRPLEAVVLAEARSADLDRLGARLDHDGRGPGPGADAAVERLAEIRDAGMLTGRTWARAGGRFVDAFWRPRRTRVRSGPVPAWIRMMDGGPVSDPRAPWLSAEVRLSPSGEISWGAYSEQSAARVQEYFRRGALWDVQGRHLPADAGDEPILPEAGADFMRALLVTRPTGANRFRDFTTAQPERVSRIDVLTGA